MNCRLTALSIDHLHEDDGNFTQWPLARSQCWYYTATLPYSFFGRSLVSWTAGRSVLNGRYINMQATWKVLGLAYNRRETREKRLLDRDPDRSWFHHHTSVKLLRSHPMVSWISAAILICYRQCPWSHGLQPKKLYTSMGWHQLLSRSLHNCHLPWVSHWL